MNRAPALAFATMFFGSFAWGASPVGASPAVDYEASFARNFPGAGGEHRIADWTLYTALVAGDVVSYAAKVDPAVASQIEKAKGKGYQTQELEASIRRDRRLVAAFSEQRRRMKTIFVYADGGGVEADTCQHRLLYVDGEFRLILGESNEGGAPLSHATIAPSCPRAPEAGFQITAGHSSRFKCWTTAYATTCGWRLPDMPAGLKRVVESAYPGSMKVRWRWRGLGGAIRTAFVDASGNRVGAREGIVVTVPVDLSLQFVDERGQVVWTAAAAGIGAKSSGAAK
jgi:hypothetical protein